MKIAICDDDLKEAEILLGYIYKNPYVTSVDIHDSAVKLIEHYKRGGRYDLVFMDIQMSGLNGFQAATILHNEYHDEKPLIAFITITAQYVFEGYKVGWRYACKPVSQEKIIEMITEAQAELEERYIYLKTTEGIFNIKTKDIISFETDAKFVRIHTAQRDFQTNLSLKTVADKLPKRLFFQIQRWQYINLGHVVSHNDSGVTLSDDSIVSLSRRRKQVFNKSFEDLLRGERHA